MAKDRLNTVEYCLGIFFFLNKYINDPDSKLESAGHYPIYSPCTQIMNIGLIRDEDFECFLDGVTK